MHINFIPCLLFAHLRLVAPFANPTKKALKLTTKPSNLIPLSHIGQKSVHPRQFRSSGTDQRTYRDSSFTLDVYTRTLEVPDRYSTDDWFRCMKSLPNSYILRRIAPHLVFNMAITALFFILYELGGSFPIIPTAAFSLITSSLALMLVFRTNSAYDRFWEARKIWGSVLNNSRSMARFTLSQFWDSKFYKPSNDRDDRKKAHSNRAAMNKFDRWQALSDGPRKDLGRYIAAFAPLLMLHLRGNKDNNGYDMVRHLLTEEEMKEVQSVACPPYLITRYLTKLMEEVYSDVSPALLKRGMFNADGSEFWGTSSMGGPPTKEPPPNELVALALAERQRLEFMIDEMINYLGMCERIARCPVPYSFSRHLSRFLTLWTALVPIVFITAFRPTGIGQFVQDAWTASGIAAASTSTATAAAASASATAAAAATASDPSILARIGRFLATLFVEPLATAATSVANNPPGPGRIPLSLWGEFWSKFWLHIGTNGLMSWSLLGIQEIGHYIEEPFGMEREELGMAGICNTVERDVLQALESCKER